MKLEERPPMDPEVLADLQLRASSQYDSERSGAPMRPYGSTVIVEHWPCRRPGCKNVVGVTEVAIERVVSFSETLAREGDAVIAGRHPRKRPDEYVAAHYKPLDATAIVFCGECIAVHREMGAPKRRAEVERMRTLIVELKTDPGPTPMREREIVIQLRAWHHPDVEGLTRAIAERRTGAKAKPKARTL